MRKHLRRFVEVCRDSLPLGEPIYEFGALQVQGDHVLEDLRDIFPGRHYVGTDMRPGAGVDVVLDLHGLELRDGTVGTAICMDTLEHVEYPRKAVQEMWRVLAPGGILIMSSVMNFPIHGYPNDYWRFTPEGFRSLLGVFDGHVVGHTGPDDFPHSIIGVGFKGTVPSLATFDRAFASWRARCDSVIGTIAGRSTGS